VVVSLAVKVTWPDPSASSCREDAPALPHPEVTVLVSTPPDSATPIRLVHTTGCAAASNVALTSAAASIVTLQVGSPPAQAPPHSANTEPGSGVATRCTVEPSGYVPSHATGPGWPPG
jgi:hypothetical protein